MMIVARGWLDRLGRATGLDDATMLALIAEYISLQPWWRRLLLRWYLRPSGSWQR
jgi:hypothetical protein